MARVTIEDCLRVVPNRFHVVMIASKRARDIASGRSEALVPLDNDKPSVLALREIADQLLTIPEDYHKRHLARRHFEENHDAMLMLGGGKTENTEAETELGGEQDTTLANTDHETKDDAKLAESNDQKDDDSVDTDNDSAPANPEEKENSAES